MRYKYRAFTAKGIPINDTIIAKDRKTALARLVSKSLTIESLKSDWLGGFWELSRSSVSGVNTKDKIIFTRNLAVMVKSGLTLDDSLGILAEQSTNPKLTSILTRVNEQIQSGKTLAEGLAQYPKIFSRLYVSIVAAAERSGTLEQSLRQLSDQLNQSYEIRVKIRNALFYPAVVMAATFSVMIFMSIYVLPKITKLFVSFKTQLPLTTRIIIAVSDFMTNHTLLVIVAILLLAVGLPLILRLPSLRPLTHRMILRLPVIGQFARHFNTALFCRTLGTLVISGVPINQAIEITADTMRNVHYGQVLREVAVQQQTGDTLGNLLRQHRYLFSPMVYRMVGVGEESGNLEEVLIFLADFHEREIDYMAKNLTNVMEPLLLLIIGGAVLVIAMGVITPIYQITGSFQYR